MHSWFAFLLLSLALAAPASAHLLHRGVPLSELAASSPVAVVGKVVRHDGLNVELVVTESVLGSAPSGPFHFAGSGHHPPRYTPGSRVLVFVASPEPPWVSRQTSLDLIELPEADPESEALLAAVRGYAGLRAVAQSSERLAQLKTLSLGLLDSPSDRLRHEALLDLVAISSRTHFADAEIKRIVDLASRSETPDTLAPGLIVLLTAIRQPEADRALFRVLAEGKNPQARARAAQVIGNRHGAKARHVLEAALEDPATAVRATAQHVLAKIDKSTALPQQAALATSSSNPREGNPDAEPPTDSKVDPN